MKIKNHLKKESTKILKLFGLIKNMEKNQINIKLL